MHQLFSPADKYSSDNILQFEQSLWNNGLVRVAGTDEVGRGPLAGPVVAAAVILPQDCDTSLFNDSKKLSHTKRLKALEYLYSIDAHIGLAFVDHRTIDEINILQASLLAMKLSIEQLIENDSSPEYILVDGKFEVPCPIAQTALIKGDSRSASIAAASIVAKESRDSFMAGLHQTYPHYNFIKNQGYPTKEHKQAIREFGPCPHHRKTFNGVKQFV